MKIQAIYLNHVGPLDNHKFDFYDDWRDTIFNRVLFSGPNGSGKSLVFRAIAEMWQATGYWLDSRQKLPNKKRDVMAKDEGEQLKRWVQGKQFYRQHVTQVLNRFLGGQQHNPEARKRQILKTCPLPNDLDFLYQRMGLL
jgi:predicted ATPase